ncbi:MAG TPA: Gmad2 immunoglobulin-like domain-containing protein [Ktedonobacteraceae bacterium]|nr:Gmad2 immunoglobulin-like domain-containing protein [Ktedonobacteraceae bacterium]
MRSSSSNATASTSPGIDPGPQPCPDAVKAPAHWDAIIPTQNGVTHVEKVICVYLTGTTTLQALVTVRYQGTGQLLDVYVYDDITSPDPSQLFKLQSLYNGDARISAYNTVLTAEVDQSSSINAGKSDAEMSRDLFREFQWSDGAGTLVPVSFPGIFPDLTRYQAEDDQAQVNHGQDAWKLNAAEVARNLATETHLLNWPDDTQAVVVSGGGSNDSDAVVTVKNPAPPGDIIRVSLERLERNINQGIWEVVAVTASAISITAPQSRDILTSPMKVTGTGNAFEGVIGTVDVLDHAYTPIGHAQVTGATGNGHTTFSTLVSYNTTFKGGKQDGIVVLYAANNAGSTIGAAVMIKELLG